MTKGAASSAKQSSKPPPPEKLSFEAAMEELESLIERIERGEIGLEESLAQRKRGDALIKRCREVLDAAEQELEQTTSPENVPESESDTGEGESAAEA